jgi:predicted small lipoprotein YifL
MRLQLIIQTVSNFTPTIMLKSGIILLIVLAMLATLTACGRKGPLFLPPQPQAGTQPVPVVQPVSSPATTNQPQPSR